MLESFQKANLPLFDCMRSGTFPKARPSWGRSKSLWSRLFRRCLSSVVNQWSWQDPVRARGSRWPNCFETILPLSECIAGPIWFSLSPRHNDPFLANPGSVQWRPPLSFCSACAGSASARPLATKYRISLYPATVSRFLWRMILDVSWYDQNVFGLSAAMNDSSCVAGIWFQMSIIWKNIFVCDTQKQLFLMLPSKVLM
jgi:hypothetical protein